MNIFVTDESPEQSAINLDDKRIRHMPKETLEILALYIEEREGFLPIKVPFWQKHEGGRTYEHIKSHPVTQWVFKSRDHLHWATDHCFYLIQECHHRDFTEQGIAFEQIFNKFYLRYIRYYIADSVLNTENIKFRNSSLFKDSRPTIQAYRDTMNNKWFVTDIQKPVTWTNRDRPKWTKEQLDLFGNNG